MRCNMLNIDAYSVIGMPIEDQVLLDKLLTIFNNNASSNATKNKYYEGKIPLSEVNLCIALPQGMMGLEIGCAW